MDDQGFYTLKGYDRVHPSDISPAMEDYLEMICRFSLQTQPAKKVSGGKENRQPEQPAAAPEELPGINELAARLNVRPSSASKMAAKLKEQGYLAFERYGELRLTGKGRETGAYLLRRHQVLHRFFCLVNRSDNELELVEKIEHFIDPVTLGNLERLLAELAPPAAEGGGQP